MLSSYDSDAFFGSKPVKTSQKIAFLGMAYLKTIRVELFSY